MKPGTRSAALLAVGLALTATAQADTEFIRGDANGDGRLSAADGHYALTHLFREPFEPACLDALDFERDGHVNISDAIRMLNYVSRGGPHPCAPFPDLGTTAEDSPTSGCEQYGSDETISDSTAAIEVRTRPAAEAGKTVFEIYLSSSRSLAGFSAVLSVEGSVLTENQNDYDADSAVGSEEELSYASAAVLDGELRLTLVNTISGLNRIEPGVDRLVMEATLCTATGTSAGDYALAFEQVELIDWETAQSIAPQQTSAEPVSVAATVTESGCDDLGEIEGGALCADVEPDPPEPPDPPPGPQADFRRGDFNSDGRISLSDAVMMRRTLFLEGPRDPWCEDAGDVDDDGGFNIADPIRLLLKLFVDDSAIPGPGPEPGPDPTPDSLGCEAYDVVAPEETTDVVRFEDVTAAPGQIVAVPVYISNERPTEGFQIVVDYEPSVFEPRYLGPPGAGTHGLSIGVELPHALSLVGTAYEGYNQGESSGYASLLPVDDDTFVFAFVPNLVHDFDRLPAGEEQLAFRILGEVNPNAVPGTVVSLTPTHGENREGVGPYEFRTELTYEGNARFVSILPVTQPGLLQIVADVMVFRGDANSDGDVNIADATFTLDYLFTDGAAAPGCPDAADANDDGALNISDPIAILVQLFLKRDAIAPPYPSQGVDPTPDLLPACATPSAVE